MPTPLRENWPVEGTFVIVVVVVVFVVVVVIVAW